MKLVETGFQDLFVIEPKIFGDHRGYFFESYNQNKFNDLGLKYHFVQDNESFSSYGTLRGLHFQKGDSAQAKLVRVSKGSVLDVVVDLRKGSSSFGKHFSVELNDENKKMMIVPRGFAHGFIVLSETAIFNYKCDNFYDPQNEDGIIYNDETLMINWIVPQSMMLLSEKDLRNKKFKELYAE